MSNASRSGTPVPDSSRDCTDDGPIPNDSENLDIKNDPANVPIPDHEFPKHFRERGRRLFSSHGNFEYPLPVDGHEQKRMKLLHEVLYCAVGAHYFGPVREVLLHDPDNRKRVLDLGTGTGLWVLDMASEFPHVRFDAIDTAPIATRMPPDNVNFYVEDMNERLGNENETFDLVHARSIAYAVDNWPDLLDEVARVLVPDGLFLSGEWGSGPVPEDRRANLQDVLPAGFEFLEGVQRIRPGVRDRATHVARFLQDSGHFFNITSRTYKLPVGEWPEDANLKSIGAVMYDAYREYLESFRTAFQYEGGWTDERYDHLVQAACNEARQVPTSMSYITVHARRKI